MNLKSVIKSLNFYTVKKGFSYLRQYGFREFRVRLSERFEETEADYANWCAHTTPTAKELKQQSGKHWTNPVRISVLVPVYCTPEPYLKEMIESVQAQSYPFWELCLADASPKDAGTSELIAPYLEDKRILYHSLGENRGIAENTNEALRFATGEYVAFLDHDDLLSADALFEVASVIASGGPDLIYSDEDKINSKTGERYQPNLKPDFNRDLLRSNNYICHLTVVKRALALQLGGLNSDYNGAQDHDFLLRCTELTDRIAHVPKVLYHWRVHEASTADNPLSKKYAYDAGKRAVQEYIRRTGRTAEVTDTKFPGFYSVRYAVEGEPLVSIVIPNKDERKTLQNCLHSIREKSTWKNYEIIIVENNSEDPETFSYYSEIDGKDGIRVVYWDGVFNYAALNNYAFTFAKGQYIVCLNNDITVITPDWIERLLGQCQAGDVGIVGAKLYYPDDTIQHAGVIVGIGGVAGSLFVGMPRARSGYLRKAILQQDLSAVTAACMMVDRKAWEAADGFDEELAVAFNDVDFCLRVRQKGYLVVYEPNVEMYHYESKTRGYEDTPEKQQRFKGEIDFMQKRWADILRDGDPYYNPNFSLTACDYSLRKTW